LEQALAKLREAAERFEEVVIYRSPLAVQRDHQSTVLDVKSRCLVNLKLPFASDSGCRGREGCCHLSGFLACKTGP